MASEAATRPIWCCGCQRDVDARLTTCAEVYPHRPDLAALPRWRCDACGNHVGCHHQTDDPTRPLGVIPDRPMAEARKHIHAVLDPIWKNGRMSRTDLYKRLTAVLGHEYHTAEIRTLEDARTAYRAILDISRESPTQAGAQAAPAHRLRRRSS